MINTTTHASFPSVVPRVGVRVPFLDLKAQYASLRNEIEEVVHQVLESAHYVGGERVDRFEEEFARYVGARYAVATGSGTAALELVLRALGIGHGDEVIVPAYTFFATAEAVSLVGATPVFADVDTTTCHIDATSVERCITARTRAVIPVHIHGRAMDMTEIEQLANARGLDIVEDACQAHGAQCDGVRVGGSSRPACFSFYPGKNLGAYGDGGAVTCNDSAMAQALRMLRDHGSPTKYQHVMVGTNSRLDAVQAAVLSVKLRHLDDWNLARVRHADTYLSELQCSEIRLPAPAVKGGHNFHLFVVRTPMRDKLRVFLGERGIETGIHYPAPLHLTQAYAATRDAGVESLAISEKVASEVLSLPMYPELTDAQIREVIGGIQDFVAVQQDSDVIQVHAEV